MDEEVESSDESPEHVGLESKLNGKNKIWKPPLSGWLNCNIGCSWSSRNRMAGGAWVLRDEKGVVLLHSRRAFGNVSSKKVAGFKVLLWTIESMSPLLVFQSGLL